MLTSKRNDLVCYMAAPYIRRRINKAFNWLKIESILPRPGHSVLYLSNHFSWWDGFLAGYVAHFTLKKKFHIMMQADQIEKRKQLRYLGAYSLPKEGREALLALNYTARLLDKPDNLVTLFPQGELRSNHLEDVHVQKGVLRVISQVKKPCQVIYASVLIDYFESIKPSAYIRLHDCGNADGLDHKKLQELISGFHQRDLEKQRSLI